MPIQCSATSCTHNKDEVCYANGILIEGSDAHTSSETACSTYTESVNEGSNGFENSINSGDSPCTHIACEAESCMYNDHKKCMTGAIVVNGSAARSYQQPDCETYRQR